MLNRRSLYFSQLSKILGCLENLLASNFSSKCVWGPFECLSDGFVPLTFVLICVLAGITVTTARNTVEPRSKTFAVKLKTATVTTITTSESFRRRLQTSRNMFWRLRDNFLLIVVFAWKIAVRNKRNNKYLRYWVVVWLPEACETELSSPGAYLGFCEPLRISPKVRKWCVCSFYGTELRAINLKAGAEEIRPGFVVFN